MESAALLEATESTEEEKILAGFEAFWNAPVTEPRGPRPVYAESPGFLEFWNAPITEYHPAL